MLSQSYLLTQSFLNNNFGCKTIGDNKPRGSKNSFNSTFVRNFDEISKIKYKFIIIFILIILNFAIFRFIFLENISDLHLNEG